MPKVKQIKSNTLRAKVANWNIVINETNKLDKEEVNYEQI